MLPKVLEAVLKGFGSPIWAAFLAKAKAISSDISIGLKTLLRIVLTSILDNLSVEFAKSALLIPNVWAASKSSLKFFLTSNKALFAFIYESTISLGSIGPPRNASLVNKDLDSLTPLW